MARFKTTLQVFHFLTLAGLFMPPLTADANALDSTAAPLAQDAVYQLRIYEIFDNNKVAFHERFRDHAMRIMARHGFDIIALWETKTDRRTEFVYLIRWPDTETMRQGWVKLMALTDYSRIPAGLPRP